MKASVWYVGDAPYFSRTAARAAAKDAGLPVVPMAVCGSCDGNGCISCGGTGEVRLTPTDQLNNLEDALGFERGRLRQR